MAVFNYNIRERVKINLKERGTDYAVDIPSSSYHDERTLNITSGSFTDIVKFDSAEGAGTSVNSNLQYFRFTNHSTGSVVLQLSSSKDTCHLLLASSGSFMFNTTSITGSFGEIDTFDNIAAIKAQPAEATALVEYFLVSK